MKKLGIIVIALICCIGFSGLDSVEAQGYTKEEVLEIAFNGNVPTQQEIDEMVEYDDVEVVYDSRYDSKADEVIKPMAIPASYDYYKTYHTGITVKNAAYPPLDLNITFYVNVFFILDSSYKSYCVGYENPVITGYSNNLGATGYKNPKVIVSSYTKTSMTFKGTATLVAGATISLSGTKTISLP